jgi:hypothetical protein
MKVYIQAFSMVLVLGGLVFTLVGIGNETLEYILGGGILIATGFTLYKHTK